MLNLQNSEPELDIALGLLEELIEKLEKSLGIEREDK
jgi:hypothetical protein